MSTIHSDLRFLQELHDVGKLFVEPPLTALTPALFTEHAYRTVARIGTALKARDPRGFDDGSCIPEVFVMIRRSSYCCTTPHPKSASVSGIEGLFRLFGMTLEWEPISDTPPL